MQGILASDLTLAQVKNLSAVQRLPAIRSDAQSGFSGEVLTVCLHYLHYLLIWHQWQLLALLTPVSGFYATHPAVLVCIPVRHNQAVLSYSRP